MNASPVLQPSRALSPRQAALIAGLAILLLAVVAAFSYGVVFKGLVVPADATATVARIQSAALLFRCGLLGWLLIVVLDVLVAWALYLFLEPVHKSFALLTAWFRLSYTGFLAVALLALGMVAVLLAEESRSAFDARQVKGLVLLFLTAFEHIWSMGLVLFGLHLLGLAYLVFQSDGMPKYLGTFLAIAALGYLLIPMAQLLLPVYSPQIAFLERLWSVPMALGELALALWLMLKGGKEIVGEPNGNSMLGQNSFSNSA